MKYFLYRLPMNHPAKFIGYDFASEHGVLPARNDYVTVYAGEIEEDDENKALNKIWEIFNSAYPEGYRLASLSVSDVIGLWVDSKEINHWYVDSIGFKRIWS